MIRKAILPLLLTLLAGLTACGGSGSPSSGSDGTNASSPGTSTGTAGPDANMDYNPLTGLYDIPRGEGVRPIALMIGNNDRSWPQPGIDKADLYMECETEAGITRLMAVFSGTTRLPDMLGPLRSARPPFITMAKTLDAIYVNYGGEKRIIEILKNSGLDNINLQNTSYGYAWDEKSIDKAQEYRQVTSAERMTKRAGMLDFDTASPGNAPFVFGDATTGPGAGRELRLRFSATQTSSFVYDEATKQYAKGNVSKGEIHDHLSREGTPLTVSNVLVLFDEAYMLTETHVDFRLRGGEGLLLTGGTSRTVQWSRTDGGLTLTDSTGTPALTPGKTYLCVARTSCRDTMVLK